MKKSKKSGMMGKLIPIMKISGIVFVVLFVLLAVGVFISPQPFYTQGFRTLTEIQKYASATNELTPLESENAVKPDFTRYYKRFAPSITNTIKAKLGGLFEKLKIKSPPAFTPSFFKTVLEEVNKIREQKGFKKENIVKVTATPQSKFIVVGDLQAAFHSLVRDLLKLKELGILGEDLKIIPSDCYIIFIGNVPSRSPFSMETLGLVLRLMQQNPDRVLYTKGSHESDGYWEEHTLKNELKIRAAGLTKDETPLLADVNKLFDSLPLIIYLAAPAADKNAFVRFSRVTRAKLSDKNFAQFLMTDHKEPVTILSWQQNPPVPVGGVPEIKVKAIMRVEKKRETYQPSDGLRTLAPEMGVTTWTLLSAPTLAVERGFKFYNDTFALIEAAAQIEQWKITLFYQDRRKKDGYKTKPLFLTSGRETAVPAVAEAMASKPAQQPPAPAPTDQQPTPSASEPTAPAAAQPAAGKPAQQAPPQPAVAPAPAPAQTQPVTQPSTSAPVSAAPVPAQPAQQPTTPAPAQPTPAPVPTSVQPTSAPAAAPAATQPVASKPVQQEPPQPTQASVQTASTPQAVSPAAVPAPATAAQVVTSTPTPVPVAAVAQAPLPAVPPLAAQPAQTTSPSTVDTAAKQ